MTVLDDPLRAARRAVRAGRFREALTELSRVHDASRESSEALLLAAMAEWRLGQFATSLALAERACAGFREAGDADGEMRAENVAAAGAFGLGDLEEAEEGFSRALLLAKHRRDDLMVARCSNNLGNVAFYMARHETAHGYYNRARVGFETQGFYHGVAETWVNTAIAWRDVGAMPQALTAADRALEAAEWANAPRLVAEAFAGRGEAAAALGDVALGRAQVERGLRLARREGDRVAEADGLRILCTIERHRGMFDDAARLGREALAVAGDLGHPWTLAEIQRDLAEVRLTQGRRGEAARGFDAAADQFIKLGSLPRAATMRARAVAARG